jgi:inorganic phosphate transporter, PiT family
MSDMALPGSIEPAHRAELDKGFNPLAVILFAGIPAGGLLYVAYSLYADLNAIGTKIISYVPFLMLFVALLIALGFEFVSGFRAASLPQPSSFLIPSAIASCSVAIIGFGVQQGTRTPEQSIRNLIGKSGLRHRRHATGLRCALERNRAKR